MCFLSAIVPAGLRVLRWAIAERLPCDARTATAIACRGDRTLLDWAIAQGCPFSRDVDASFDFLVGAGGDAIRGCLHDILASRMDLVPTDQRAG